MVPAIRYFCIAMYFGKTLKTKILNYNKDYRGESDTADSNNAKQFNMFKYRYRSPKD